ncbi:MAG: T9SS type A sorting domain-containing protein [Bacteroidota bacterium]
MKKHIYTLVAVALILVISSHTYAQVAAMPFTPALDSFNVISGTTIDAPNADDNNYHNLPIGFDFYYHGTAFHNMTISNNGYISLDSMANGSFYNPMAGPVNNVISALGGDLINHLPNASLQYVTIGSAPNRICIIQWLHYSYFVTNGDLNFQIQLYETSNCIRFVYGTNTILTTPYNTQIGLRGDSNLDYIALGDSTCNWANAYPYPSISSIFPISLSCSMPSGFAFHFGSCQGNGMYNFGYITGKVFNDLNGNGLIDTLEPPIPNHIVHIMPGNYYVSSDAAGNYNFFFSDSAQTYNLNTASITYWTQTNSPVILSCNPATQACSGYNFGFHEIPNVNEVSIICPNWGARPTTPEPMPISYQNDGTSTLSDTITFVMDSLYSFIDAIPTPSYVNGQTIKWAYTNLLPGQHASIMLHLMPSASAVLGNYLNSSLTIGPLNDTIPTNNVVALHQLITNAWDPNEKLAEPSGMIPAETTIHYCIHFQNTGNAPANNVTVNDVLDASLDPLTFNLLGSSHPVNFSMSHNGTATFTFFNIQLPDSGSNFTGSNGYVSFSIKTKAALPALTVINNLAGIVFDSNPAILTNITADTIRNEISTDINTFSNNQQWIAYPNPSTSKVTFRLLSDKKEKAYLKILNIEGQKVFEKQGLISYENIDISQLTEGIYICTLQSEKGIETIKLIKQK